MRSWMLRDMAATATATGVAWPSPLPPPPPPRSARQYEEQADWTSNGPPRSSWTFGFGAAPPTARFAGFAPVSQTMRVGAAGGPSSTPDPAVLRPPLPRPTTLASFGFAAAAAAMATVVAPPAHAASMPLLPAAAGAGLPGRPAVRGRRLGGGGRIFSRSPVPILSSVPSSSSVPSPTTLAPTPPDGTDADAVADADAAAVFLDACTAAARSALDDVLAIDVPSPAARADDDVKATSRDDAEPGATAHLPPSLPKPEASAAPSFQQVHPAPALMSSTAGSRESAPWRRAASLFRHVTPVTMIVEDSDDDDFVNAPPKRVRPSA